MDVCFELGGVPTEDRFQNLTDLQWMVLINHLYEKKKKDIEMNFNFVDYLAMLTSMNGKATKKAIDSRRRQMNIDLNKEKDDYVKVDKKGENVYGIHVNTTFLDSIKEYGGEEAFKMISGEVEETSQEIYDNDSDFIEYAKKMAAQEEAIRQEEIEAANNADTIQF